MNFLIQNNFLNPYGGGYDPFGGDQNDGYNLPGLLNRPGLASIGEVNGFPVNSVVNLSTGAFNLFGSPRGYIGVPPTFGYYGRFGSFKNSDFSFHSRQAGPLFAGKSETRDRTYGDIGGGMAALGSILAAQNRGIEWGRQMDRKLEDEAARTRDGNKKQPPAELPEVVDRLEIYFNKVVDPKAKGLTSEQHKTLKAAEDSEPWIKGAEGTLQKLANATDWVKGNDELARAFLDSDRNLRSKGELTPAKKLALLVSPTGNGEIDNAAARKIMQMLPEGFQPQSEKISEFVPKLLEALEKFFGQEKAHELITALYTFAYDHVYEEREIDVPKILSAKAATSKLTAKGLSEAEAEQVVSVLQTKIRPQEMRQAIDKFPDISNDVKGEENADKRELKTQTAADYLLEVGFGISSDNIRREKVAFMLHQKVEKGAVVAQKFEPDFYSTMIKRVKEYDVASKSGDKAIQKFEEKYRNK